VPDLISNLLAQRVRRNGAEPLITYYDLDSGERTELSAVSFANWVNKTSNLLVDEFLIEHRHRRVLFCRLRPRWRR